MIDVLRIHHDDFFGPSSHQQNNTIITAVKLDLFSSSVVLKTIHDDEHRKKQPTKLLFCLIGIFVSYLIFGIVQESM